MDEEDVLRNMDRIVASKCLSNVCSNSKISDQFLIDHQLIAQLDPVDYWSIALTRSQPFVVLYIDVLTKNKRIWASLCQNPNLDESFYRNHMKSLVWSSIILHPRVSDKFIRDNMSSIRLEWAAYQRQPNMFSQLDMNALLATRGMSM